MSLVLEEPVRTSPDAARRLRLTSAAVRLAFTWWGVHKSLSAEQKSQAADSFGAEGHFLSARKKLIDTVHPAFKGLSRVRHQLITCWKHYTLPYPEPGIRLIAQNAVEDFNDKMLNLQEMLSESVQSIEEHYAELRSAARQRLGRLYNQGDYPESLQGMFSVAWNFPSIEAPEYLQQLSPELYRQECQRVASRFDEALRLAEQAFIQELHELVSHLGERLNGQVDGKPKVFRNSAIENLTEFFDRFRRLNVNSNAELDVLVEQCRHMVQGIDAQSLRDSEGLRQSVASDLSHVESMLDGLLVDRPRRNILRRAR